MHKVEMESFWEKDLNVQRSDIEKERVQFNEFWPQPAVRGEVRSDLEKKNEQITNYLLGFAKKFVFHNSEGNGDPLKGCKHERQVRLVI